MDYAALAKTANTLLKGAGILVTVNRAGLKVSSGYAVFVASKSENDDSNPSSLLAQTSITNKMLLLSGLAKEPMVGDTITADKITYTVQTVEKVRPASVTVLYKCEVA